MSNFVLKIIAIITMLIDHVGITLVTPQNEVLYLICRGIGRLAFPIFAFLLVEGFFHTSNLKKYCIRLGIFAVISELPFDLIITKFAGYPGWFQGQNIFFTLLLGIALLAIYREIEHRYPREMFLSNVFCLLATLGFCIIATVLHTDYAAFGILLISSFYLFRGNKAMLVITGLILFGYYGDLIQMMGILAYIPICFYNGKQGKKMKYFFYIFYPLHLLILYVIGSLLH